jgi:transposase
MGRFVAGANRSETTLFPECLDDRIDEDNAVRVVDAFVDAVDLGELGFVNRACIRHIVFTRPRPIADIG